MLGLEWVLTICYFATLSSCGTAQTTTRRDSLNSSCNSRSGRLDRKCLLNRLGQEIHKQHFVPKSKEMLKKTKSENLTTTGVGQRELKEQPVVKDETM